jgi:predicted anti-sigma-YlaC factor YlaD
MSHPRFESMLFEREDLEAAERLALEQHLQECDACCRIASNWAAIEAQLRKAPMSAPMPGFPLRFQQRLALQRRRRRVWLTIGFSLTALVSLLVVAIIFGSSFLSLLSPGVRYLLKSLTSLMLFGSVMQVFTDFISLIVERLVASASPGTLLSYSTVFSGLAFIWFASMYKLNIRTSFQEAKQ